MTNIEQIKREALEAQGLSLVDVMSTGDTLKKYAIIYAIDYLHSRGYLGGVAEPVEELLKKIRDQIGFCKKHDHAPALDKTMLLINKFLGEK